MKVYRVITLLAWAWALSQILGQGEAGPSGVQIETCAGFSVVGITVRTNNSRETGPGGEIPKLWQRAMQPGLLSQIAGRADENIVVVNSDYASDEHGDYDYTLGVRVTDANTVPSGFTAKEVRPGRYAVLHSQQGAPWQVVPALWKQIWTMTPADLGGNRAYQTDFEIYPPGADPQNIRMEVHLGLKAQASNR